MDPDRAQASSKRMIAVIIGLIVILVVIPLTINAMITSDVENEPIPQAPVIVAESTPPPPPKPAILPECADISLVELNDTNLCISDNTYSLAVVNDGSQEITGLFVSIDGSEGLFTADLPFEIAPDELHHGRNEFNTTIGEISLLSITPYVIVDAAQFSCVNAALEFTNIPACE